MQFAVSNQVAHYGQGMLIVTAMALLGTVGIYLFTPAHARQWHNTNDSDARDTRRLVYVAMMTYCLAYGYFTLQRHYHFNSAAYDLGIQDQAVWNTSRGNWYGTSFEVSNYMGDHFKPLIAIFAPLYWLYPTVYWLLAFQVIALTLGAIPVYQFASRRLQNYWAGLVFAVCYLLYPAVGYINRTDFHWEAAVVPMLLAAINALDQNRWRAASVWLALSLLGKEDIGVTIAAFGLWLAWHKRPKFGLLWTFVGVTFSLVTLFVIIPTIRQVPSDTLGRYLWLGETPLEIVKTILSNPLLVVQRLINIDGVRYLMSLFGPLTFLPSLSSLSLVILPAFSYNIFSDLMAQRSIYYQYVAPIIPITIASAIYGADRVFTLARQRSWWWLPHSLLLAILLFTSWHTFVVNNPLADDGTVREAWRRQANAATIREALAMIPEKANVFTTNHYAPHLTHRRQIQILVSISELDYLETGEFALFNLQDYRSPYLEDWTCADYKAVLTVAQQYNYGIAFYKDSVVILRRNSGDIAGLKQLIGTLCE